MVTIVDFLAKAIKDKPTDGSDCKTLERAQKELGRLRRITGKVVKVLNNATELVSAEGGGASVAPDPPKKEKVKHKKRKGLTIDQSFQVYEKVTVEKSSEDRALIRSAIKTNALFKDFMDTELEDFIDVFAPQSFSGDATVIQQGSIGNTFYVVQAGSLDIYINMGSPSVETQVGVPYRRGGAFGELALLYESPRAATIRASEDTVLWVIERKAYKGLQLQIERRTHNQIVDQLKTVKIGEQQLGNVLNTTQIESMAMATQVQKIQAGATIIKEGEKGNTFYVITRGEVDIFKKAAGDKKLITLGKDSFFGEKALLGADTRQASCIAATNVECLTLARDDFVTMLGDLDVLLSGKAQRMSMRSKSIVSHALTPSELDDFTLERPPEFHELKIKRVLGEGAFGKVNLVKSKVDGKLYALKAQAKATIIENGSKDKLVTEYRLMRELSHPFIVQCFNAYQDSKYIFFLMGLLPGGEVLDLLDEYEQFPESWTQFYCATVVLVFEFMHQQRIAYRDLKPENLVLDADGYCHMIDLGLAKKCELGKTWTMCGTPDYLAPEIIKGKGHDWGADYWALGVLLYELTHGWPPFYDENPSNIAKKVISGEYDFPTTFSRKLIDLIARLLVDPSKRLGRTQGGARKIRKHPWFADFDFQALLDRKLKVPWKPEIANLEKLGTKDDGKWDAPETDWNPELDSNSATNKLSAIQEFDKGGPPSRRRSEEELASNRLDIPKEQGRDGKYFPRRSIDESYKPKGKVRK